MAGPWAALVVRQRRPRVRSRHRTAARRRPGSGDARRSRGPGGRHGPRPGTLRRWSGEARPGPRGTGGSKESFTQSGMLSSAYQAAPAGHQATAAGSLAPHIVPVAVLAGACCVHPRRIRSRPRRSSSISVSIRWFWFNVERSVMWSRGGEPHSPQAREGRRTPHYRSALRAPQAIPARTRRCATGPALSRRGRWGEPSREPAASCRGQRWRTGAWS